MKIEELKEEINYWKSIEKQIDNCPKENYEEFTRLEKLWINCPIDVLKAQLKTLQERNAEVKKVIEENRKEIDYCLCYGLKQNLTEKQIEQFKKIFITLYENKLLQKLGLEE